MLWSLVLTRMVMVEIEVRGVLVHFQFTFEPFHEATTGLITQQPFDIGILHLNRPFLRPQQIDGNRPKRFLIPGQKTKHSFHLNGRKYLKRAKDEIGILTSEFGQLLVEFGDPWNRVDCNLVHTGFQESSSI